MRMSYQFGESRVDDDSISAQRNAGRDFDVPQRSRRSYYIELKARAEQALEEVKTA